MKQFLRRYGWWFLLACLAAAVAVIGWWQWFAPPGGREARERYDRIRLGMTSDEVVAAMGSFYSYRNDYGVGQIDPDGEWKTVAKEGQLPLVMLNGWQPDVDQVEVWADESVGTWVFYRGGETIMKQMRIDPTMPPWKVKAREWLDWLRGRVGW